MKLLINIIIVGMFGVEVCSPFMIGYMNKHENQIKANNEYIKNRNQLNEQKTHHNPIKANKAWETVDYSSNAYSDSKALKIKE